MPRVFRAGLYWVYFWSNENLLFESEHVHVSQMATSPDATNILITAAGKCLMANNNSGIKRRVLANIERMIEACIKEVLEKWDNHFGERRHYC